MHTHTDRQTKNIMPLDHLSSIGWVEAFKNNIYIINVINLSSQHLNTVTAIHIALGTKCIPASLIKCQHSVRGHPQMDSQSINATSLAAAPSQAVLDLQQKMSDGRGSQLFHYDHVEDFHNLPTNCNNIIIIIIIIMVYFMLQPISYMHTNLLKEMLVLLK